MSETRDSRRRIAKMLRALNDEIAVYIASAYKLGQEVGRDDIFSKRKLLDAVKLEITRGLPAAKLHFEYDVRKSTRQLPA